MASLPRESERVHVVAVPLPAQGHMSPMMHLCKRIAAEENFMVSFVNVDSLHQEMMKHWITPKGLNMQLVSVPFSWNIPRGFDAECLSNLGRWYSDAEQELPPALSTLIEELSHRFGTVSCIISDYFLHWTQDIADKFGIPRVILWSGNAAWATFEYHIPQLMANDHIFPSKGRAPVEEANSTIVDYIRGLRPLPLAAVPDYMLSSGDEAWKEISVRRSPYVKRAAWVLVNSFYELEKNTFDFLRSELGNKFVPAGPMFLLDKAETGPMNVQLRSQSNDCVQWLDLQEKGSVLYVSFGSIAVLTVEQFDELASALEASEKPFLWVIRPELVVGGTSSEKYESFIERTKAQGFFTSWAPQLSVLAHPSVGAFLTHCGWNSTVESMCNGVPMIGWPYGAEQNTNCHLIEHDWKIGMGLNKDAKSGLIDKAEVQRGIYEVMDSNRGKEMKTRVQGLMKLGRNAMENRGPSVGNLIDFLDELKSNMQTSV